MSDDPRDDRPEDAGNLPPGDFPAPWQRREEGTVDMQADEEGQATYIAGNEMSLDSKLRGGGQDQSADNAGEATRLCPACSTVTVFVDGKCTNCEYMVGSTAYEGAQEIRHAVEGDDNNPVVKVLLIVLIAIVVIVLLAVGIPRLLSRGGSADTEAEAESTAEMYNSGRTYAGALDEIEIDAELHADVKTALLSGNGGWAAEGVDAYAYRYKITSEVTTATSQRIRINVFVGGDTASHAVNEPGNVPFLLGTADLIDRLNSTAGVEATVRLYPYDEDEVLSRDDVYIRYGYYFGLEHMDELQPLIDGLDEYYRTNQQYPHLLSDKVIRGQIKTKKGFYFVPDGIGYLPIFKSNNSGNIVMGTGSGMASLLPEACVSYYLFKYTRDRDTGLDLHGPAVEDYYANKIAPFPYAIKEPVHNIALEPDGNPDGIGCVVKDGKLLDN